jgi:histidinol-phosphate aminotransferase
MNALSISRRKFAQLLTLGAAGAVVRPPAALGKPLAAQPLADASGRATAAGLVRLSSNENPYGPSTKAFKAMSDAFNLAWRYPDEHADGLIDSLAKINSVNRDQILLGDGSSEILQLCAEAFTGKGNGSSNNLTGKLVAADPTFEAILHHASVNGAEVVKVPLTSTFSHDLPKMMEATNGGLIYICNPNNPTASITPKNGIREFLAKTPRQIMILVDEAYYHFADSPEYESVIPLVKDYSNLIVSRTFSKIYGMAGLRCGYCVAQPETITRIRAYQSWDSVNIMALAAAKASLEDADQVNNGRRVNSEVKAFAIGQLDAMGYQTIPSQANFVMIDVKRSVVPLIQGLKERHVLVGRLFPALPNHMRLTIGKKTEMEAFLAAFRQVIV